MPDREWIYPDRDADEGWPPADRLVDVRLVTGGWFIQGRRAADGHWWTDSPDWWGEVCLTSEQIAAWRELP